VVVSASLEAQIASLRSDLARTKRLYGLTVLAFGAVALVAAGRPPDVIRAHRFEAIDAKGDVHATLSASEQTGELTLAGGTGDVIYLSAIYGTTRLVMNSEGYRHGPRAVLATTAEGSRLDLGDELGISRVTAAATGESQWVRVFDRSGIMRAEMGGSEDGTQLFVGDPHGGPSVTIEATPEGMQTDLGD
jgi:hypothetical protein